MDSQPPAPETTEPVELLRLLRQPHSGQLIVEVAGHRYDKLASITEKKIGQYILKLTAQLLAFTNGVIMTEAGTKSVYNPRVGPAPEPLGATPERPAAEPPARASEPVVPEPPPEAQAAFLASLRNKPAEPPEEPARRGLFGRPAAPTPDIPTLNLADEINDIVQTRLRYSSLADTTQINISSDPAGGLGLRIEVNGRIYTSPDDVADPAVKELIKAAIKEWESS
jgi:hypothetical protein